jgi:hypothetical protein
MQSVRRHRPTPCVDYWKTDPRSKAPVAHSEAKLTVRRIAECSTTGTQCDLKASVSGRTTGPHISPVDHMASEMKSGRIRLEMSKAAAGHTAREDRIPVRVMPGAGAAGIVSSQAVGGHRFDLADGRTPSGRTLAKRQRSAPGTCQGAREPTLRAGCVRRAGLPALERYVRR